MANTAVITKRSRYDSAADYRSQDVNGWTGSDNGDLGVDVIKGDIYSLPQSVKKFIETNVKLCTPNAVYI